MDITLQQYDIQDDIRCTSYSFNPYFNGYYTSTRRIELDKFRYEVLILILMDITLQQVFSFNSAWTGATACLMDELKTL